MIGFIPFKSLRLFWMMRGDAFRVALGTERPDFKVMFGFRESHAMRQPVWSAQESLCGCCCQPISRGGAQKHCKKSAECLDVERVNNFQKLSISFNKINKFFQFSGRNCRSAQEQPEDHAVRGSSTVMRDFFQVSSMPVMISSDLNRIYGASSPPRNFFLRFCCRFIRCPPPLTRALSSEGDLFCGMPLIGELDLFDPFCWDRRDQEWCSNSLSWLLAGLFGAFWDDVEVYLELEVAQHSR